jgi:hypothetical protein
MHRCVAVDPMGWRSRQRCAECLKLEVARAHRGLDRQPHWIDGNAAVHRGRRFAALPIRRSLPPVEGRGAYELHRIGISRSGTGALRRPVAPASENRAQASVACRRYGPQDYDLQTQIGENWTRSRTCPRADRRTRIPVPCRARPHANSMARNPAPRGRPARVVSPRCVFDRRADPGDQPIDVAHIQAHKAGATSAHPVEARWCHISQAHTASDLNSRDRAQRKGLVAARIVQERRIAEGDRGDADIGNAGVRARH